MKYRCLGQAGMKVSAISLGGWINFGEGKVPAGEAEKVIVKAYEPGTNLFDIADIYGRGEAEKQMGAVLKHSPRQLRRRGPVSADQRLFVFCST